MKHFIISLFIILYCLPVNAQEVLAFAESFNYAKYENYVLKKSRKYAESGKRANLNALILLRITQETPITKRINSKEEFINGIKLMECYKYSCIIYDDTFEAISEASEESVFHRTEAAPNSKVIKIISSLRPEYVLYDPARRFYFCIDNDDITLIQSDDDTVISCSLYDVENLDWLNTGRSLFNEPISNYSYVLKQRDIMKDFILCSCILEIYEGHDNSESFFQKNNYESPHYNTEAFLKAEEYARLFLSSIKPSPAGGINNGKPYMIKIMKLYKSKELDRFVKSLDKYLFMD